MPDMSLYWCGNECIDVTGGWNLTNFKFGTGYPYSDDVSLSKMKNKLLLKNATTTAVLTYPIKKGFTTANLIDFTPYNNIRIINDPHTPMPHSRYMVITTSTLNDTSDNHMITGAVTYVQKNPEFVLNDVDISSVKQSLYGVVMAFKGSQWEAYNIYIDQLWLE